MPYLKKLGKSESCLIKKTLNLPHFLSVVQPENMRKRALDAGKGSAGAGMSGNKQEPLEKKGNEPSPYMSAALTLVLSCSQQYSAPNGIEIAQ